MRRMRFISAACLLTAVTILIVTAAPSQALTPPAAIDRSRLREVVAGPSTVLGTGGISGVVFFDANGDGIRGADEGGVEGAQLVLANLSGAPIGAPLTTGLDGAYQFSGLDAGTYKVTEIDPPGLTSTTGNTRTVTAGATNLSGVDFGDTALFVVRGTIFQDLDGDGVQQPAEPGTGGVPVELYADTNANGLADAGEPLLASTVTDGFGAYVFQDVWPGYRVVRILPPGGTTVPGGNQAALNLIAFYGGVGLVNEMIQDFTPVASGYVPACAFNTSILAKFNDQALPASQTIWFTARLKATGLSPTESTTVYFENTQVQFGWSTGWAHLYTPRGKVVFDPAAPTTTTSYDVPSDTWTTTVSPGNWDKDVFLTGLSYAVPSGGLPNRLSPVTWSGRLEATRAGVTLEWEWSAAVYTTFGSYAALGVKPVSHNAGNPYLNGDKAGAPENYKASVTEGARGNGGSNYTGNDTPAVRGLCISPGVYPYALRVNCGGSSHTDATGITWNADRRYSLGAWGYTDGAAKTAGGDVNGTADDFLYQRYREKPGEYRFTVPIGTYNVKLKLAEFSARDDERLMRITMEGTVFESSLDISDAAGRLQALDKTYTVSVADGLLNILFAKVSDKEPVVSAIEVVAASGSVTPTPTPITPTPTPITPTPTPTPVPFSQLVNAGSVSFTDESGQNWAGDKAYKVGSWGYTGGAAKKAAAEVAETNDDDLYRAYRENPHDYLFTVPNGQYDVTLKFAEFVVSTASERMMKITIEGAIVEPSLSIYGNVAKNKAFDRTYAVNVTDGILNINFAKAAGSGKEPVISAIKVHSR